MVFTKVHADKDHIMTAQVLCIETFPGAHYMLHQHQGLVNILSKKRLLTSYFTAMLLMPKISVVAYTQ